MRRIAVVALLLLLAGCENHTAYGRCVGLGDDQQPTLHYKVSKNNVLIGVILVETVIVPAYVVLYEFYCPVAP